MTGFTADVGVTEIITTGITQGIGLGLIWVPLSTIAFATLPGDLRTQGAALVSLIRNLGSSMGISFVIYMLGRNTQVVHSELVEHLTPFAGAVRDMSQSSLWNLSTPAGRAALNDEVMRQATTISYINDFMLLMTVALIAIPLLPLLRRPTRHAPRPESAAD